MALSTDPVAAEGESGQPVTRPLRGLPWLLLLVGALITWRLDVQQQQDQQAIQLARFHTAAVEVVNALERELHSDVTILRGVTGLFVSSVDVTRQEFANYVRSLQLDTEYSGIQGVGFAQWLAAAEVPARQAAIRAEGFPDFSVHPLAPARPHYSSIIYLEPFDWRNQRAFGYDMFSEPVRQEAMRRAVETGQPALSGRITLLQETKQDVQAGFLIYVPVYAQGVPLASAEQRWRALRGWAYSPLRAGRLVDSFMSADRPPLNARFGVELFDGPQALPASLLYRSTPPGAGPMAVHEEHMGLYGADWLVRVSGPLRAGAEAGGEVSRQALLLYGAALTVLVALLAQVMLSNRQRIANAYRETVADKRKLEAQQDELRLAATVMDASPIGIVVTDAQRQVVSVNPAFSSITGVQAEDVIGRTLGTLHVAADGIETIASAWRQVDATGRWSGELAAQRRNGEAYPELLTLARVNDPAGQPVHYIGLLQDITERRQQEERIRQLALHDYLTGLGNRALLIERATQELARAQRYGNRPVVLFMDLDRFKPINDAYGHDAGDAVLIAVAQRLTAHVRDTDLVCRQGGDEFILLLPDHEDGAALLTLADKLVRIVAEPVHFGGHALSVEASIGIATYPEHGTTVETLIQRADEAMYAAKAHPDRRVWLADAGGAGAQ